MKFLKQQWTRLRSQDSFFAILLSLVFFVILMVGSPYFFMRNNLLSLQTVIAPRAIIAIGMMLLVTMGMFDLSVGSVMGVSGILCAYLLSIGIPAPLSVLAAISLGMLVGFINGALVAWGKIIPLIATIGTMYIFRGLAEMIMTSNLAMSLRGFPQAFLDFGSKTALGMYSMTWIMLFLLILVQYLLKRTYLGRSLYYIGGNPASARSLGFRVNTATIAAFIASGGFSALAGVLSIARYESASRYLGQDIQMDILIACIIGGGSLLGGKGDMTGALAGTIFISLLQNAFNLFEINTLLKSVVIGGILVLVVIMDGYMHLKKMRALGRL